MACVPTEMAERDPPNAHRMMSDGKSAACAVDDSGQGNIEKKTMSTSLTTLCDTIARTVGSASRRTMAYGLPLVTMFRGASEGGAAISRFGAPGEGNAARAHSRKEGPVHPGGPCRGGPSRPAPVAASARCHALLAVSFEQAARLGVLRLQGENLAEGLGGRRVERGPLQLCKGEVARRARLELHPAPCGLDGLTPGRDAAGRRDERGLNSRTLRVEGRELLHAVVRANLLPTLAESEHALDFDFEIVRRCIDVRQIRGRCGFDRAVLGRLLHRLDQALDVDGFGGGHAGLGGSTAP